MARPEIVDRALDALSPLGPTQARPMFGGWGLYVDDAMVGLIAGDLLYLKTDAECRGDYEEAGLEPFRYSSGGRTTTTSYHRAPDPIQDWEALAPWAEASYAAARRAALRRARRRQPGRGSPP